MISFLEKYKIMFASTNTGKLKALENLFADCDISISLLPDYIETLEKDDIVDNARRKALAASITCNQFILASDESMYLDFVSRKTQPGASIKRVLGKRPSDYDVFEYYKKLLGCSCEEEKKGQINTAYAIAYQGEILDVTVIERECLFMLPGSKTHLKGRPLASLHYIPNKKKYYSELCKSEKIEFERKANEELIAFVQKYVRKDFK